MSVDTNPPGNGEAGSLRELLAIATPMILSSGVQAVMHVVDRMFLTWYDTAAMAAALPAGILAWSAMSLFHGTAQYVNTFVAQYEGAKRPHRVAAAVWQGVYFSLAAGLFLMMLAPLGPAIMAIGDHSETLQRYEAQYFGILSLGGIPAVLVTALACFFSGRGDSRTVFWVSLLEVIVDGVLSFLLIFGPGPFPRWGMVGGAIGNIAGLVVGCIAFSVLLLRPAVERDYQFRSHARFDWPLMKRLLWFGLPNGFLLFVDVAGFTLFIFIIGWIGEHELAATNIAFNLNSLAFIPVIGCGTAVSTLVGQRIGGNLPNLAARSTHLGFALSGGYMLLFGLIYVGLPDLLIGIYGHHADPADFAALRETATLLLRFVALYSFFDAMAIIYGSAIRGAGDTFFATGYLIICSWGLLVFPTWLLWQRGTPSLWWCWMYCSAYIVALGLGYLARFLQGRWKTMTVIEPDFVHDEALA